MPKISKPYRSGISWSMRRRIRGEELFVSGASSAKEAAVQMQLQVDALLGKGRAHGLGPWQTTLGLALTDYARETLPFLKGAPQEVRRINRYLRPAEQPTLKAVRLKAVEPHEEADANEQEGQLHTGKPAYFEIEIVPAKTPQVVPRGLAKYRKALAASTADSDRLRARLAGSAVADITRHQLQLFMNQLRKEGLGAASVQNERALLRGFWNYAHTVWHWKSLDDNVATGLRMPKVKEFKARVMTLDEQSRLQEALEDCRNALVAPSLTLLRETAMRTSEPIDYARWGDVDWNRQVLHLRDAKTHARDVPLSSAAIEALRQLQTLTGGAADQPLVTITYEALKAAWNRACERADIQGLRLYDLRHTAATRAALQFGNVWLVQALTGHKTLAMVERYTHVPAEEMVKAWNQLDAERTAAATSTASSDAASGQRMENASELTSDVVPLRHAPEATPLAASEALATKVIQVDFARRRAG
jgi:integrase